MPLLPRIDLAQLEADVRRAEAALRPAVVMIKYTLEDDWTGDPSIFFKVVLADEVIRPGQLGKLANRLSEAIREEVHTYELGLNGYFAFRSHSEHREMNDPAWA